MQVAGEEIETDLQLEKEKGEVGFEDPPYKIDLVGADEKIRGGGGDRMIDQSRCCCCDGGVEMVFVWEMFFRLLCKASLVEGKVYSQLSYLCSLAYSIPDIKVPQIVSWSFKADLLAGFCVLRVGIEYPICDFVGFLGGSYNLGGFGWMNSFVMFIKIESCHL